MRYTKLMAAKITEAATDKGINPNALLFADSSYLLPSNRWVLDIFSAAWDATKRVLDIVAYEPDMNDCDDYARMCAGYAQLLNNRTLRENKALPRSALAFGEFWYMSPMGAHAINAYFYQEEVGGDILLGTFEPQTGKPVELTRQQIYTCSLFRL